MKSQAVRPELGIAAVLIAVAVIVAVILWTTQREEPVTTIRPTPRPLDARIPPLDAAAPKQVAVATFALG
jgi:K+ transporter